MDAKQARNQTKRSIVRNQNARVQKALDQEQARKDAYRRGRVAYKEGLSKVRKAIRAAVNAGENSTEVNVSGAFTETDRENYITDNYYRGAQSKIKQVLEEEGYKVEVSQKVDRDEPVGSDPMFYHTMYWLMSLVKVSW